MKTVALVIAAVLLLVSCGREKNASKAAPAFNPGSWYGAIEKAREAEQVSFAVIDSLYTNGLMQFVKASDRIADSAIRASISNAKAGKDRDVNSEVLSKTIQKVFFNVFFKLLDSCAKASDSSGLAARVENMRASYEVLSPTVVRRSSWIGHERELDDLCRMQLDGLGHAFGKQADCSRAIATLGATLKEVYALSVLFELEGLAAVRKKDTEKCEEKEAEARTYFSIIAPLIPGDSLRKMVEAAFAAGYEEMDIEKVMAVISGCFQVNVPASGK